MHSRDEFVNPREARSILELLHRQLDRLVHETANLELKSVFLDIGYSSVIPHTVDGVRYAI